MTDKQPSSSSRPVNRRVLVVDEDRDLAGRLEALLHSRGYEVALAHDTGQAVTRAEEFKPGVALIDIHIEESAGFDLLARLREKHPDLYCILITARAEVETAVRALEEGVFAYLIKPLDETQLLVTLERCLETAASEKELGEARETLRRREDLYHQAIAYAHAVAYQRDYTTKSFSFVDEGIYELTGYRPQELTPEIWGGLIVERVMEGEGTGLPVEEAIRRTWAGQLTVWNADYRIRTRGGEERWLADSSVQLHDEQGKPIGSLGILQDITPRKRAEEELRKLNVELEERVAKRTEELRRINQEMERTNQVLSRTVAQLRERERMMAEELNLAQEVQLHFLPKSFPFHEDLRFAGYYHSCSKIGGDLYDAFRLGDRVAGFYIADASGHGVSAALVTAVLKVSFERLWKMLPPSLGNGKLNTEPVSGLLDKDSISVLLNDLSHALVDTIPDRSFVTFQFGILFLDSGRLLLGNAGHNPPIRFTRGNGAGQTAHEIAVTNNLPLGLTLDWHFQIEETQLGAGDKLVLYTDGITEAHNNRMEEFGLESLLNGIERHGALSPEDLIERLTEEVSSFIGDDLDPHDDQSILVVDYGPAVP